MYKRQKSFPWLKLNRNSKKDYGMISSTDNQISSAKLTKFQKKNQQNTLKLSTPVHVGQKCERQNGNKNPVST